jgi:hypothetical protein
MRTTTADSYRVGRNPRHEGFVVKQAPGWKVIHKAPTLQECAAHLLNLGVALKDATVVSAWPWLNLEDTLAQLSK